MIQIVCWWLVIDWAPLTRPVPVEVEHAKDARGEEECGGRIVGRLVDVANLVEQIHILGHIEEDERHSEHRSPHAVQHDQVLVLENHVAEQAERCKENHLAWRTSAPVPHSPHS